MKPLLRAVLIVDALLLLGFGLLFLLTPWTSLYNALLLVQTQPALVGQAFGVALIGLAWLALHASIDGALTSPVARAVGHVNWLTGVLMLIWLLGLHTPALTGFGQIVAVLTAVVLLVLGLGSVRLAGAVRRRDKLRVAEAVAAERAEKQAVKDAAKNAENRATNRREPVVVTPAAATAEPAADRVDPVERPVPYSVSDVRVSDVPVAPPVTTASDPRPLHASTNDGLTASEHAARAEAAAAAAREEARKAADEASNAPRPPLHG